MKRLTSLFDGRRIGQLRSRGFDRPQCVLFMTHQWSDRIAARYFKLVADLDGIADVFLLHDLRGRGIPGDIENAFAYSARRLQRTLGYKCFEPGKIVPGSAHLPLLWFAQRHACAQYWVVEYDVEFTGDWSHLVRAFEHADADLVAAHVRRVEDSKDWVYWRDFTAPAGAAVTEEKLLKAFFPVYRMSAAGIAAVHDFHKAGYRGHYEMFVPTCLSLRDMRVADLKGEQRFYAGDEQDPVSDRETLSTLRWRPAVDMTTEFYRSENLIYHPVK